MKLSSLILESKSVDNKKLYQDEEILVVRPLTHEASCRYGSFTKWCIATSSRVHWDSHFKNNFIVYYLDKINNRKFAILIPYHGNESEMSVWNQEDDQLTGISKLNFIDTVLKQNHKAAYDTIINEYKEVKKNPALFNLSFDNLDLNFRAEGVGLDDVKRFLYKKYSLPPGDANKLIMKIVKESDENMDKIKYSVGRILMNEWFTKQLNLTSYFDKDPISFIRLFFAIGRSDFDSPSKNYYDVFVSIAGDEIKLMRNAIKYFISDNRSTFVDNFFLNILYNRLDLDNPDHTNILKSISQKFGISNVTGKFKRFFGNDAYFKINKAIRSPDRVLRDDNYDAYVFFIYDKKNKVDKIHRIDPYNEGDLYTVNMMKFRLQQARGMRGQEKELRIIRLPKGMFDETIVYADEIDKSTMDLIIKKSDKIS